MMPAEYIETKFLNQKRKHITGLLRNTPEISDNRLVRLLTQAIEIDKELISRKKLKNERQDA